jgi:hypothetical protein
VLVLAFLPGTFTFHPALPSTPRPVAADTLFTRTFYALPCLRMVSRGEVKKSRQDSDDEPILNGLGSSVRGLASNTIKREGAPPPPLPIPESKVDAMRAQAGVLRTKILKQQQDLEKLEREIEEACSRDDGRQLPAPIKSLTQTLDRTITKGVLVRAIGTFVESVNLLLRKLDRVRQRRGPENERWSSVGNFLEAQAGTGIRIVGALAKDPTRLKQLADPYVPSLVPHAPAIIARLDRLENHVAPILEKVLNNRRHLASIEPYLEGILERFDDIEPHLPWILQNIDVLAPYTGLLLKHIDELLLYADVDESEGVGSQYALAEQLLPYLEFYVSRLDLVGPHLPLLRPHITKLLKHNRISKISPHIDSLFEGGYITLATSANADILLFYLGWVFRIPFLPRLFFSLPFASRLISWFATRLPKRFVRRCQGVECSIDYDYGINWNSLSRK